MGQGSNIIEKEALEMMNVVEVARMTECLKALGLSDAEIIIVQNYIATGVGLPTKEPAEKESD
ncbi:hypothetical protein [uncultured Parasutterella sp.]|uniref:hypothetical protein n=1 Tax=uncultured Parasutterella sp. TaxID=1263098 RepID=UPI002592BE89|nr:hypothetical protein [uncultured Parasutterella sp.]